MRAVRLAQQPRPKPLRNVRIKYPFKRMRYVPPASLFRVLFAGHDCIDCNKLPKNVAMHNKKMT
jgi:hypothetical protein